jgi:transcriptional regulator with GAF, ATPase, and Fis domain
MAGPDFGGRLSADAGAALAAFLDLDDLLRRAVAYASESAATDTSRILLHDAEAHEFVVAAAIGPADDTIRGARFPETAGIRAAVLTSGQAHLAPPRGGSRALMAAPLNAGGRIIGVVETMNRAGGAEFTSADVERFVSCCGLIAIALENASLYRRVGRDSEILRRVQDGRTRPLVAESAAMRRVLDQAERAAAGRSTILLTGETGTGKEQVARRIHERSSRASGPFVPINCAALPEGLLESELFGHEKGAFTGADRRRLGWFELADGGTLLLDEIGDLPAPAQGKLLRVLQEHEITRVGGHQAIRVNVRLIAATHRTLAAEVRAGRFREDLFFRLHVVPIHLPPLRERPEDVEPMARLFLDRFAADLGRTTRRLTPEALALLRAHHWPGNVRELENLAERLLVLGGEQPIDAAELSGLLPPARLSDARADADAPAAPVIDDVSLWEQEHALLVHALERTHGNQSRAARLLKISREQLRTRMRRYGLLPRAQQE